MPTTITRVLLPALLLAGRALPAAGSGAWSNIIAYTPPTPNAQSDGITAGADGAVWFTNAILRTGGGRLATGWGDLVHGGVRQARSGGLRPPAA